MKKILKIGIILILIQAAAVSISFAAPATGGQPGSGKPDQGGCGYHTVQYGDTVYSIGRQYGVSPQQIINANSLVNPDHIYAGQVLSIPCGNGYGYQPQPHPYPGGEHFPAVGYGYDFAGYYYETYYPGYRRYSYVCGYHYNCY